MQVLESIDKKAAADNSVNSEFLADEILEVFERKRTAETGKH